MPKLNFDPGSHPDLTYQDAFFLPQNPIEQQVYEAANTEERAELDQLNINNHNHLERDTARFAYVMELAERYHLGDKISRDAIDLTSLDVFQNPTPVVMANMNKTTGARAAEAAARMGGIAAIPQDKEDVDLKNIAQYLETRTKYPTAITVTADMTVGRLRALFCKRPMDKAVATNSDGRFIGIVNKEYINNVDENITLERFIHRNDMVLGEDGISPIEALRKMDENHVGFLPVLASDESVLGAYTQKGAAYAHRYNMNEGVNGGLAFLPTIGALNNNPLERLKLAVELGAKGIVLDTANFDQGVASYKNLEMARKYIEEEAGRRIPIIAGNIVTRDGVRRALSAGADIVKVGIGPGAMCSTRRETGVGRPQLSAVIECAEEAEKYGKHVWADGGIEDPRDAALALAYASQVMVGSMFAPTIESPSDLLKDDSGRVYAINMGMAARQSSELRTLEGTQKESDAKMVRHILGHRSEGVESRVYQRDGRESVADVMHWLMDGVSSSVSYAMAHNLKEFNQNAVIGIQMASGYQEGLPK